MKELENRVKFEEKYLATLEKVAAYQEEQILQNDIFLNLGLTHKKDKPKKQQE